MYNDSILLSDESGFGPTTPLFMIGNGDDNSTRSNAMVVQKNGNVGIGTSNPGFLLNFANSFGDKISLSGISGNHFGLGIQNTLMQIHTDGNLSDIAFGHGSSAAFTETMRIKVNGNVGIGNANPGFPLSFAPTLGDKISLWSNSSNSYGFGIQGSLLQIHTDINGADIAFGYGSSTAFTETMRIKGTGNVGIGTNAPGEKLSVSGNICATGTIAVCSYIRYKTNLSPLPNSLASVLQMQGFYYFWKKDGFEEKGFSDKRQIGFSAQDIEVLFPEIVQTDDVGYKSVDYSRLTPVLVEAIKEQQRQIDALLKHDTEQQQQIEKQQQQIDELKKPAEGFVTRRQAIR